MGGGLWIGGMVDFSVSILLASLIRALNQLSVVNKLSVFVFIFW